MDIKDSMNLREKTFDCQGNDLPLFTAIWYYVFEYATVVIDSHLTLTTHSIKTFNSFTSYI